MEENEFFDKAFVYALGALIAKAPFIDRQGEFGKKVSEEEAEALKDGIVKTAREYAHRAVDERREFYRDNFKGASHGFKPSEKLSGE